MTLQAEMDRGTHRKGMKLSLRGTSENGLTRWSQKAEDTGPACLHVTGIHPHETRQSFPPSLHRQTRIRNEVTLQLLSSSGRRAGAGANRKDCRVGLSQKPRPFCNGRDRLTDSRGSGV